MDNGYDDDFPTSFGDGASIGKLEAPTNFIKTEQPDELTDDAITSSVSSSFQCPLCTSHFNRYNVLQQHVRTTHTVYRPFSCFLCNRQDVSSELIVDHLRTEHCEVDEQDLNRCYTVDEDALQQMREEESTIMASVKSEPTIRDVGLPCMVAFDSGAPRRKSRGRPRIYPIQYRPLNFGTGGRGGGLPKVARPSRARKRTSLDNLIPSKDDDEDFVPPVWFNRGRGDGRRRRRRRSRAAVWMGTRGRARAIGYYDETGGLGRADRDSFECLLCPFVGDEELKVELHCLAEHCDFVPYTCATCKTFRAKVAIDVLRHIYSEHNEVWTKSSPSFENIESLVEKNENQIWEQMQMLPDLYATADEVDPSGKVQRKRQKTGFLSVSGTIVLCLDLFLRELDKADREKAKERRKETLTERLKQPQSLFDQSNFRSISSLAPAPFSRRQNPVVGRGGEEDDWKPDVDDLNEMDPSSSSRPLAVSTRASSGGSSLSIIDRSKIDFSNVPVIKAPKKAFAKHLIKQPVIDIESVDGRTKLGRMLRMQNSQNNQDEDTDEKDNRLSAWEELERKLEVGNRELKKTSQRAKKTADMFDEAEESLLDIKDEETQRMAEMLAQTGDLRWPWEQPTESSTAETSSHVDGETRTAEESSSKEQTDNDQSDAAAVLEAYSKRMMEQLDSLGAADDPLALFEALDSAAADVGLDAVQLDAGGAVPADAPFIEAPIKTELEPPLPLSATSPCPSDNNNNNDNKDSNNDSDNSKNNSSNDNSTNDSNDATDEGNGENNQDDRILQCQLCSFRSKLQPLIEKHIAMSHLSHIKPYSCAICAASFSWPEQVDRHIDRAHAQVDDERQLKPIISNDVLSTRQAIISRSYHSVSAAEAARDQQEQLQQFSSLLQAKTSSTSATKTVGAKKPSTSAKTTSKKPAPSSLEIIDPLPTSSGTRSSGRRRKKYSRYGDDYLVFAEDQSSQLDVQLEEPVPESDVPDARSRKTLESITDRPRFGLDTRLFPRGVYLCRVCGIRDSDVPSMLSHVRDHYPSQRKPFKCAHCDYSHHDEERVRSHLEKKHLLYDFTHDDYVFFEEIEDLVVAFCKINFVKSQ